MMLTNIPVYPDELFLWDTPERLGTINLSHFGRVLKQGTVAQRIWGDSYDVGFIVRSHVTGKEKLFIEDRVVRNVKGEIMLHVFRAYDNSGVMINVFNDYD